MSHPSNNIIPSIPTSVISRWSRFVGAKLRLIDTGLINLTLEMQNSNEIAVLQRLHPIFSPIINLDIATVTEHLSRHGMVTPKLLPTDDGALWVEAEDGVWRALSFISGFTHNAITSPNMAKEAGRLVGRFHAALANLEYTYKSTRSNVHDTAAHLLRLSQALVTHNNHRLYAQVAPVAESLLKHSEKLADFTKLPLRHAHGDLKISNLMFDEHGVGLALIDLDTMTHMAWPLEMGDALRSWCNPRREDQRPAQLDLNLLQAAIQGYREASLGSVTHPEWAALFSGLTRICLELSARFLADALQECYFGWDSIRYPARGEHNLARGQSMWDLYLDVLAKQDPAQSIILNI